MNIELSDNQIESLVKEVIRERIKNYLSDKNIAAEIHQLAEAEIKKIVDSSISYKDIQSISKELVTERLYGMVAERISRDIADAYSDRYY